MWLWAVGCAWAGEQDLNRAAEQMMDIDFDDLKAKVERAPRAAAPSPAPLDAYGSPIAEEQWQSPPPRVVLPLEPNSTLASVTVHRDRALVTRFLDLDLPRGPHTVTFEGLPLSMVSDGLAASVASGEARIVAVEQQSGAGKVDDTERITRVRSDAERLIDELGEVRDHIASALAQRDYLRAALSPQAATAGQPVAQVRAAIAFVAEAERGIAQDLRDQQKKAKDLAEQLDPLLIKLEDPLATGQPVTVELEVERPGPVRLNLRYTVIGAGWQPSYSARLDPSTGEIELEMYGVVTQNTGEGWIDADIALSTANPAGRGTVTDLEPWTLGRSGSVGVYGLDAGAGATTSAPPAPASGTGGVVDSRLDARVEGRGAVVLAIAGKRSIRGDGSPQRLPVGVQKLQGSVALASIPKIAPEVQRRATVRYDGVVPLLPGPASSFVGSDYVGSGEIRAVVPGETLELAFGADDRFRVTRQLVSRHQERAGRKATRYTFRFRTAIANHGDTPATIALSDQVPLSEDARIGVEVLELSGGTLHGADGPEGDGTVSWTLPVAAHGEASVELAFSVTVPDERRDISQNLEMMY